MGGRLKLIKFCHMVNNCKKCDLHKTRSNVVVYDGDPNSKIMFLGEAPGEDEDTQGKPFVGKSGQLLTLIIDGSGYITRPEVFITNPIFCRPPGNRNPDPKEINSCNAWHHVLFNIVKPKVVIPLGNVPRGYLTGKYSGITRAVGKIEECTKFDCKFTVAPILHPSYIIRNGSKEKDIESMINIVQEAVILASG